jgi:hypothetical protein
MIKMLSKILGVSEDTEMEDGTGSRLHTNPMERSHSLDINTPRSLLEHS